MATRPGPKSKPRPASKAKPKLKPKTPASSKPAPKAQPAALKAARKSSPPAPASPKPAAAKPAPAKPAPTLPAHSTDAQQRSLANVKTYFDKTLSALDERDSAFAPTPAMFSAAQQVAHVAQTVDWFLEGAFRPQGFDMDFAAMEQKVRAVTSLEQAKRWLHDAYGRLQTALRERPAAEWFKPISPDTIMGGAPRVAIVDGIADHCAHHRGALAVYARLRGKTPPMPYM